jgi:hypothetical protein
VSKRIGRWTYDGSEPLPGWHLDNSPVVLDFDPGSHSCCDGGPGCRGGAYILYEWKGREYEPISGDLRSAMEWAERAWDKEQASRLTIEGITRDELADALAELAKRTGNGNAHFPYLATCIFGHVERERTHAALADIGEGGRQ